MDCMITKLNEKDQFISKIKDSDSKIGQFYHFDAMQEKSYSERLSMPNNGREVALAQYFIIKRRRKSHHRWTTSWIVWWAFIYFS